MPALAQDRGGPAPRHDYRHWPAVRAVILANPGWVHGDAELLAALNLRPAAANVVEFGPAALARLEHARDRERTAREELAALAEANFTAQAAANAATLDLLEARNNSDLAARVDAAARERFGLACGMIAVEHAGAPAGWRALPSGFTNQLLGPANARIGAPVAGEVLFGEAAAAVKSSALVRVTLWAPTSRDGGRAGLLAFGSADPTGFTPDMGAELVAFLARVVERTADRWPPLI